MPVALIAKVEAEGVDYSFGGTITGAAPLTVNGTSDVTFGGTWVSSTWDFGEGAPAGTKNASHTYASSGTYTVALSLAFTGGPGSPSTPTWTVNVTGPSNFWTNFVGTTEIV